MNYFIKHVNNIILNDASKLKYEIKDLAPNTERDLLNSPRLIVWAGASDNTIYQDCRVNWAFRALHDDLHIKTGLDFSVDQEIELARIQASKYSGLVADLIFCEIAGQALYFKAHGVFVPNQVEFTKQFLKGIF